MAQPKKTLREIADAMRADLAKPSGTMPAVKPEMFDDLSDVTNRLEKAVEEVQEIRRKQPSIPEINVYAAPPVTVDKHDSTPAELKLAWKHRGLVVKALPWIAALGLGAGAEKILHLIGLL